MMTIRKDAISCGSLRKPVFWQNEGLSDEVDRGWHRTKGFLLLGRKVRYRVGAWSRPCGKLLPQDLHARPKPFLNNWCRHVVSGCPLSDTGKGRLLLRYSLRISIISHVRRIFREHCQMALLSPRPGVWPFDKRESQKLVVGINMVYGVFKLKLCSSNLTAGPTFSVKPRNPNQAQVPFIKTNSPNEN